MPTIPTHALVPALLGSASARAAVPWRLVGASMVAAALPDADVVAFVLGIPYADAFGHRGASHSIVFAALLALLAAACARRLECTRLRAAAWVGLSALSHPLLDAFTDGGLGVALLWPFDDTRWFAPWRPIAVSPIGTHFFSARALDVLRSEALWVLLPTCIAALGLRLGRCARG